MPSWWNILRWQCLGPSLSGQDSWLSRWLVCLVLLTGAAAPARWCLMLSHICMVLLVPQLLLGLLVLLPLLLLPGMLLICPVLLLICLVLLVLPGVEVAAW